MISVTGVHCLRCGHIVVSRAEHDMHGCMCGAVQVDGGRSSLRIVYGSEPHEHKTVRIDLAVEEKDLKRDWAVGTDSLGVFPPETHFLLNIREPTPHEIRHP